MEQNKASSQETAKRAADSRVQRRVRQAARWHAFGLSLYTMQSRMYQRSSVLAFLGVMMVCSFGFLFGNLAVWKFYAIGVVFFTWFFLILASPIFAPLGSWISKTQVKRLLREDFSTPHLIGEILDVLKRYDEATVTKDFSVNSLGAELKRIPGDGVGEEQLTPRLISALTKALPRLTPEEAVFITRGQCAVLCHQLTKRYRDPNFAVAVLRALPLFGDEEALTTVEKIKVWTKDPAVREAATVSQSLLEAQLQRLAAGQNWLLRSSEIPTALQADTLLRSVQADTSQVAPSELLKPAETPNTASLSPPVAADYRAEPTHPSQNITRQ